MDKLTSLFFIGFLSMVLTTYLATFPMSNYVTGISTTSLSPRRLLSPAYWMRQNVSYAKGTLSEQRNQRNPDNSSIPKEQNNPTTTNSSKTCVCQNNVVFIKTHKTGSTSLSHIVNRYGFTRNLSFVINRFSSGNEHLVYLPLNADSPRTHFLPPIAVKPGDFSKYKYNMLAVHVRYNRSVMDSFMERNAQYITIIRDPTTQFESAFTVFKFYDSFLAEDKKNDSTIQSRLVQFYKKPDFYWGRLKNMSWEHQKGLRFYYAKNNQIFDLGLDHVYHANKTKVQEYIDKLDRELKLVLITEYFEESLVVMKNMLCWKVEDILYVAKNMRKDRANVQGYLENKIRQWNDVDVQLYEHFNRTLWQRIKDYGPSFAADLTEFRQRLNETLENCVGGSEVKEVRDFFHVDYKTRRHSSKLCTLIVEHKRTLFQAIWSRQQPPKAKAVPRRRRTNLKKRLKSAYKPNTNPEKASNATTAAVKSGDKGVPPKQRKMTKHVISDNQSRPVQKDVGSKRLQTVASRSN